MKNLEVRMHLKGACVPGDGGGAQKQKELATSEIQKVLKGKRRPDFPGKIFLCSPPVV